MANHYISWIIVWLHERSLLWSFHAEVGGSGKGGLLVRTGEDLTSAQQTGRLATGALVEEIQRMLWMDSMDLAIGGSPGFFSIACV